MRLFRLFLGCSFGLMTLTAVAQEIQFTDVTEQVGLRKPLAGIMGHGAAWGDVNGDGWVDVYVGGFADRPDSEYAPAKGPVINQLLLNRKGKFELVTDTAASFPARTSGALFADLDNEGGLELYVANNGRPNFKRNAPPLQLAAKKRLSNLFANHQGKLVNISESSGACVPELESARNIGVMDYDGDGLLDLLVIEDRFTKTPQTRLYRNLGQLKFADVTKQVGIPEGVFGLGLAVADVNRDGSPDFFIGHSNRLFLSTGQGTYVEDATVNTVFAWKPLHGEDWPCGAAWGDLDRDGDLDLVLSIHCETARNRIYLNLGLKNGVPQFQDVTDKTGLPQAVSEKSPHVEIQDLDNDGWPDLYFSTAWKDEAGAITPLIFQHKGVKNGVPQFQPIRPLNPNEKLVYFPAGPSCDYDQDGRVDLLLVNWFQENHCRLLRNTSPKQNWLQVRVSSKGKTNRMGIGSRVSLYPVNVDRTPENLLGTQEVTIGYGYASGQEAVCHFGLGSHDQVQVVVQAKVGGPEIHQVVKTNQRVTLSLD